MRSGLVASSSLQQAEKLRSGELLHEALKVEPGQSASSKSISDSIQSCIAYCLSSKASALSVSRLSRQLSISKNNWKRESDEPGHHCDGRGTTWPGMFMFYVAIVREEGHQPYDSLGYDSDNHSYLECKPESSSRDRPVACANQRHPISEALRGEIDRPVVTALIRQPTWLFDVKTGPADSCVDGCNVGRSEIARVVQ